MKSAERCFLAIDLKSFYASVECVERGLDPLTARLVVADPDRSRGTICLAVSPALKKLGVKKNCRIYEVPQSLNYITAKPRMQLYLDYSSTIYSIYLRYLAAEDIHVYSIDECFLDATGYLKLYGTDGPGLAEKLMEQVLAETGITATAGAGSNLYLCKIAMDMIAKHSPTHIGQLDPISYRRNLWDHRPLTDFWRIGRGTASRLEKGGMFTMGDIARVSLSCEDRLYRMFGVDAELLIDHAWGLESCTMADIKAFQPKTSSLSSSQVLMRNYSFDEARIVVKEMTDALVLELVEKGLLTDGISLWIGYDHKTERPGTGGSTGLLRAVSSSKTILAAMDALFVRTADPLLPIRRIGICFLHTAPPGAAQLDLFTDERAGQQERQLQLARLAIQQKYGKNALLRGMDLLSCGTAAERNRQIGGHRA